MRRNPSPPPPSLQEYTRQLRSQVAATGLIDPTGCVELPMF